MGLLLILTCVWGFAKVPNRLPKFLFKKAVEATSTGVIVTDHRTNDEPIIYANPFFLELTGYREDEVIGRNCRFLQGPESDPKVVKEIRQAIRSGTDFHGEILNYRKDGTSFWNHLTISPVKNEKNETLYFVGVQQDITAEKSALKERDALISELKTINEGLSNFASTTSHELKNPLSALIMLAHMMEMKYSKNLDEEGRHFLSRIASNAQYLNQSLDELLLLSSLGHSSIQTEVHSLREILSEAIQVLSIDKSESFIHIAKDLPPLKCNRQLMSLVFKNLVDNAIKYGMARERGVLIDASCANDVTRLTVRDRGKGVDQDIRDTIFEPFVTTGRSNGTGTGLGLAIVKKIIELHGGTIECHSRPDGTEFVIQLPAL